MMSAQHPTFTARCIVSIVLSASLIACSASDTGDRTPDGGEVPPAAQEGIAPSGGYAEADIGSGEVTYGDGQTDKVLGSCEISRRFVQEDVGDISTRGLVVSAAVDNTATKPEEQVSYTALNDSSFTLTRLRTGQAVNRIRGTLSRIAYESALTPRGTSQAIALVSFTGQGSDGVPVVAQIVCEIQNKFQ